LLGAAAAAGAFVIEDDFARWLSHNQRPPAPLLANDADGRVVYLTSLSKVVSPGLRVGVVIARGPVAQRLHALRAVDDMFVSRPLQEATLELVSRPIWDRHLKDLSRALNRRAAILFHAVGRHLPAAGVVLLAGVVHLWSGSRETWTMWKWQRQRAAAGSSSWPGARSTLPKHPNPTCVSPSVALRLRPSWSPPSAVWPRPLRNWPDQRP
jgi:DNA-binding transcriptional MocR family regulator